jgi:hypothetical protein
MNRLTLLSFLLIGLAIPVAVLLLVPPYAQPLWYHDFADQRCLVCVPNALNVVSNLPFVLVGGWGLLFLASRRSLGAFRDPAERWSYFVFFAGIALTGVGSAYYHWHPDNARLLWDRLPLAVAFMAFFAAVIAERIDRRAGLWLLVPLAVLGGGSVVYWHLTEVWGRGDLRPYFLVQFYPLAAMPFILLLFPARYTRAADVWGVIAWYAGAKGLELLDGAIYTQGQVVSGHTLKHLVAAVGAYMVLFMLQHRRPLPEPVSAVGQAF